MWSGESEIRTREPLLTVTRFPGVPLQPLEHLSKRFSLLRLQRYGFSATQPNFSRKNFSIRCKSNAKTALWLCAPPPFGPIAQAPLRHLVLKQPAEGVAVPLLLLGRQGGEGFCQPLSESFHSLASCYGFSCLQATGIRCVGQQSPVKIAVAHVFFCFFCAKITSVS